MYKAVISQNICYQYSESFILSDQLFYQSSRHNETLSNIFLG
jgi:hypothetical protein